ncbi:MAG: hypothetical protein R3F60_19420 [bacterium]
MPRALPELVTLAPRYLDRIVEPVLDRPADPPPPRHHEPDRAGGTLRLR